MNELVLDNPSRRAVSEAPLHAGALSTMRYTFGAVWNRRWIAFAVAVVIFAGFVGLMRAHPHHYAEAMLVVHPNPDNPATVDTQQSSFPPDSSAVDTEVEILRSPAIAEAVIRTLKLYQDPEFGGTASYKPSSDVMAKVVPVFMAATNIRRVGLTYAIQVGFVATTMEKAKRIANAIVAAYVSKKMDEKLATISRANHDLGSALSGLREQALQAQAKVEQYVADHGLLAASDTTTAENEMSNLNQQIANAEAETAEKEAMVSSALAEEPDSYSGSGASGGGTTIGALRQREADVAAQLAQLKTQFRSGYPLVEKTQAQLDELRHELRAETGRIMSSLRADAMAAEKKEASLIDSRAKLEQRIADNNRARVGLLTLRQAADSAKTIYETYLKRASQLTAERGLQQADASVESAAIAQPAPHFSSLKFVVAAGLMLAAIGSVLLVLIIDMWTPKIRSLSDVTRETGMTLAGVIPDVAALSRSKNAADEIADNPLTVIAEAFRGLGAFLSVSTASRPKIIAATSAVPGEGKTLVSICLARTLAATGSRVILLDCDVRRAGASTYFPRTQYGIADVIDRSVPVERALIRDVKSGLWFLSASGRSRSDVSTDLFSGKRIDALLSKLAEEFDHIVIDTPPILGAADARFLAAKAERVLYLVQWNKTPSSVVRAAVEILRQCNARGAGVVLNKVNVRQQALYGFADGSDYYHHYGSAYPQVA